MADGSVSSTASQVTNTRREGQSLEFFSLNGSYTVAEGTSPQTLLEDAGCLAECVDGALQALIDGLSSDGSQLQANPKDAVKILFGVMYQVQMMGNLAGAAGAMIARSDAGVPNG